jgi:predicted Zn-dependent protease with MMP-like domain
MFDLWKPLEQAVNSFAKRAGAFAMNHADLMNPAFPALGKILRQQLAQLRGPKCVQVQLASDRDCMRHIIGCGVHLTRLGRTAGVAIPHRGKHQTIKKVDDQAWPHLPVKDHWRNDHSHVSALVVFTFLHRGHYVILKLDRHL